MQPALANYGFAYFQVFFNKKTIIEKSIKFLKNLIDKI